MYIAFSITIAFSINVKNYDKRTNAHRGLFGYSTILRNYGSGCRYRIKETLRIQSYAWQ